MGKGLKQELNGLCIIVDIIFNSVVMKQGLIQIWDDKQVYSFRPPAEITR